MSRAARRMSVCNAATTMTTTSQIVTRSAAATAMMAAATSIQRRHAAQRSALVMGVLARGAVIYIVFPIARAVHAPEAVLLAGRATGFLRSEVLPLGVEELHGL